MMKRSILIIVSSIVLVLVLTVVYKNYQKAKMKEHIVTLESTEATNTPEDKLKLNNLYEQYAKKYIEDSVSSGYLALAVQYNQVIGNNEKTIELGRVYNASFSKTLSRPVFMSMAKSFAKTNADSTIKYFEWAQNIEPLDNSDLIKLGDAYEKAAQNKEGSRIEDKLIKAANIRFATGYTALADSLYKSFYLTYPNSDLSPYAYMRRVEFLENKKDIKGAKNLLKELIRRYPQSEFAADAKIMLDKELIGKTEDEKFHIITKDAGTNQ